MRTLPFKNQGHTHREIQFNALHEDNPSLKRFVGYWPSAGVFHIKVKNLIGEESRSRNSSASTPKFVRNARSKARGSRRGKGRTKSSAKVETPTKSLPGLSVTQDIKVTEKYYSILVQALEQPTSVDPKLTDTAADSQSVTLAPSVTDSSSFFKSLPSLQAPDDTQEFNNIDDNISIFSEDEREDRGARPNEVNNGPSDVDAEELLQAARKPTVEAARTPTKANGKRKERDPQDLALIFALGSKRNAPKTLYVVEDDVEKEKQKVDKVESLAKQAAALKKRS